MVTNCTRLANLKRVRKEAPEKKKVRSLLPVHAPGLYQALNSKDELFCALVFSDQVAGTLPAFITTGG